MHDYTNGMATKTLRYYPNGTLQQTIIYKQEDGWPRERLLYEADSAGNININRGNGTHKDINIFTTGDITEYYTMEGPFKLGAKDGLWKGKNNWGTTFEETYDRGKLLSGISKGANGRTYHYTHKFEYPAYKNGRIRFEDFIFTRMKHPADTAGLIMTSAHRLKLSYTIDETGKPVAFRGYRADNNTEVYLDMRLGLPRCTAATLRGVPISYPVIYNHSIPDINMKIMWNESIQPPATNAKSPFNTNTYLNGTLR
jgi:hypothetical protein